MSADDLYGPALPPGFTNKSLDDRLAENSRESNSHRKRRRSSSSSSSNSSHEEDDTHTSQPQPEKKDSLSSPRLFGPVLPSTYISQVTSVQNEPPLSSFIGPVLPSNVSTAPTGPDFDDEGVGPSLDLNTESKTQSTIEQIESRAKLMKDKLEGKDVSTESAVKKREDWMVELPPEMTKNFGVTARKFSTKTTSSVDKDRSVWTDTPADRARKEQELLEGKVAECVTDKQPLVSAADQLYRTQVDEYNRLARPKSLLEMHTEKVEHKSHHKKKKKKKSKDDKEKKKKKWKKKGGKEERKVERTPFNRDRDLTVSRMDDTQRKSVISRSKELGGRFGHGSTQFL